ncbi:hypothetical protein KM043_005869 [Ampulex compressa]|nr:hypothetical protein KM043_005869 [Ampulex compressa]
MTDRSHGRGYKWNVNQFNCQAYQLHVNHISAGQESDPGTNLETELLPGLSSDNDSDPSKLERDSSEYPQLRRSPSVNFTSHRDASFESMARPSYLTRL